MDILYCLLVRLFQGTMDVEDRPRQRRWLTGCMTMVAVVFAALALWQLFRN